MNKVILEFNDVPAVIAWANQVARDPEYFFGKATAAPVAETELKKAEAPAKKVEAPEAATVVSDMLKDIKEAGVKLADMQPSRYEGVQLLLAKKGVVKIKDLELEDQPEVLKMFTKMASATKEKFDAMLDYIKQS